MIPAVLLLCVVAAVAWLGVSLALSRHRDPTGSAAGFSRALAALAENSDPARAARRPARRRRPPPRTRLSRPD